MRIVQASATGTAHGAALMVLLPCAYGQPEDFQRHGFVAALQHRVPNFDVMLPDAHIGYYTDGNIGELLRDDVLRPARARGYEQIWVAGISIGGLGALGCACDYGPDLTGVVALAPYPGTPDIVAEIEGAGGLPGWSPAAALLAQDAERRIWHWMGARGADASPSVYLGFGTEDRFSRGHELMASALSPAGVCRLPGGHDWAVWRALWQQFVDQNIFCSTVPA